MLAPQTISGFGVVVMKLTAGEKVDNTATTLGAQAINVDNLKVAAEKVTGDGSNVTNMRVGRSADQISADTTISGFNGVAGGFGITADTLDVTKFASNARAVDIAGPMTLPDLKISVSLDATPTNETSVAKCSS